MEKQFKFTGVFIQSIPFPKSSQNTFRKHIHLVPVMILGIQQLEKVRSQVH